MKKLIFLFAGLALVGCTSVGNGITVKTLYAPGVIGDRIGEVIRVEDEDTVFVYRVGAQGGTILLGTFLKEGSGLRSMTESAKK